MVKSLIAGPTVITRDLVLFIGEGCDCEGGDDASIGCFLLPRSD